jgi:hypothetical protein
MRSALARLAALSLLLAASISAQQTARGAAFTVHVKITPVGEGPMAAAVEAQRAEWRGTAMSLAGRGRIDVVEGAQPPAMATGDYMLFEGGEGIVVRPSDRSYLFLGNAMQALSGQMAGAAFQVSLSNVAVKLDSLGGETVDGRPTSHYRISGSYDMTVSAMTISTSQTTEYWLVDAGNIPLAPFTRLGLPPNTTISGPMAPFLEKYVAATAGLPQAQIPLRQVITTRINFGGMTAGTDNLIELSGFKTADVDLDQLVLPSGYTIRTLPYMPGPDSTSQAAGDKWRTRPRP